MTINPRVDGRGALAFDFAETNHNNGAPLLRFFGKSLP